VITSLVCYVTIWNSPADVTGTGVVDDGAKKDDKGNRMMFIGFTEIHTRYCLYAYTLKAPLHLNVLASINPFCVCCDCMQ